MTDYTGPDVVALGGGHGLAASLRAVSTYANHVTAVVSVADDGGSTGRIREATGGFAVGDLRRCLEALADDTIMSQYFGYRLAGGELDGHPIGNLLLAGLAQATGDLVEAIDEVARLLGVRGRVLPAADEPVILVGQAEYASVRGQVAVSNTSGIRQVKLSPSHADAPIEALDAIESAQQLVLGPGSLYTSVIASVLTPSIRAAIRSSDATLVFVANLYPEATEAAGYELRDFVEAVRAHDVEPDVVLADVAAQGSSTAPASTEFRPIARPDGRSHDPVLLAAALRDLS